MDQSLLVALLAGVLQGVLEWLPISSEENLTLVLAALGRPTEEAVSSSLFLHFGTACSVACPHGSPTARLGASKRP